MAHGVNFIKMHGNGNDFVIIDNRSHPFKMDSRKAKKIADRNLGIGCDQLVLIEKSKKADCFMRIYNADGGEVSSCGNASRCVASIIMDEKDRKNCRIETRAGILECSDTKEGISVDMGKPRLEWQQIPLSRKSNILNLGISVGPLKNPVAVSMGNPHAVFFMKKDISKIDLAEWGPKIEHHKLFPQRVNVGVAQINSKNSITLRVWERGAGETLACGTGACAALVAANLKGFAGKKARIRLKGGPLAIEWRADGHVIMTGPVAIVFAGVISPALFK